MKIGPTVGKIQALKCFKITVMGAAILIWQSRDRFLKIAIHRRTNVCVAKFCCILINSSTKTHLISILVDIYTGKNIFELFSCEFMTSLHTASHVTCTNVAIVKSFNSHIF